MGEPVASERLESASHARRPLPGVACLILLAAVVWYIYGRATGAPFVFDDDASIVQNQTIRSLWPPSVPLRAPRDYPTAGRPLVNLSFAINYFFGELNPRGYHLFNLILHVLSGWLLFELIRRTLRLERFAGRYEGAADWLALMIALLWTVHPLQTEAVQYVTQRTELMMGLFYLATMRCALGYWAAPAGSATRGVWAAAATLACLAGMACKEVMVSAPIAVLLFERTMLGDRTSIGQALRRSWPLYAGLALGWVLLLYLNIDGPRSASAGLAYRQHISLMAWWLTQTRVLMMYLRLVFWPAPLIIHYEMPLLEPKLEQVWPWLTPILLIVLGSLIGLWRRRPAGFLGAVALMILAPTSIVPIVTEMAAERRMYLPLAVVLTLLVVGGYRALGWLTRRLGIDVDDESENSQTEQDPATAESPNALVATSVATLLAVVVLAWVSIHRLDDYRDEVTLFQQALQYQPDNLLVNANLGRALVAAGQIEQAMRHYRHALQLNPNFVPALYNLGNAYSKLGRRSEALDCYEAVLRIQPSHREAHNNLGKLLSEMGQGDEAIPMLQRAVELAPQNPRAHLNLGVALLRAGQVDQAIAEHHKSLELRPDYPEAHHNLGAIYLSRAQPAEAIAHLEQAVRNKPDYLKAWIKLADAYASTGRNDQAVACVRRALDLAAASGQSDMLEELKSRLGRLQSQPMNPGQ
ncbi:tetratricopeptide repeat protein [Fontivita pretiosa]|uniref:tetratricopeptide repeat protein n=1 Tax=Fontivita pretiosa TaxID=2989684 RepID=UPI003D16DEAC